MNTVGTNSLHRLPSPDAAAFAVALVGLALAPLWSPLQLLVPLAVFAPSLLREVGLLRDEDEYGRVVTYRAGFHALLVTVLLVFATFASARPGGLDLNPNLLTGETLRKVMLLTFVVSFLLQYWGPRTGSFRILLGLSILLVVDGLRIVQQSHDDRLVIVLSLLAATAALVALAFVVRRWARVGGVVLLLLCLALVFEGVRHASIPEYAALATPAMLMQAFIVPGAMAVALLRPSKEEE